MYRILVVDDDVEILKFCKHALKNEAIEVVAEASPYRVLDMVKVHRFNLAILDIHMPVGSGLKLLEEIKSATPFNYPVLMFTAKSNPKDVQSSIKMGALDYLIKPLKVKALQERVAIHLEKTEEVLSVKLKKPQDIQLTLSDEKTKLNGQIIEVSEYGLKITSDQKIPKDTLIGLNSDFFTELIGVRLQSVKMTCISCEETKDQQFESTFSNINLLNASMIEQLRIWCKKNYIEFQTPSAS